MFTFIGMVLELHIHTILIGLFASLGSCLLVFVRVRAST